MARRLQYILALLCAMATAVSSMGQEVLIPFAADLTPTFTFSERYTESGAWSDDDEDFVDLTSYDASFSAKASMTGIAPAVFDDKSLSLKVTLGTLELSLPFAEATRSTTAAGVKVVRWFIEGYDPNTFEDLSRAGTVELRYDATSLSVTYTLSDDWEEYGIVAYEDAGEASTLNYTLPLTFAVGPYGFTGRVTYVAGSVEFYDLTVNHGSELYEFTELSKVRLSGEIDSAKPSVQIIAPAEAAIVTVPSVTVSVLASDDHSLQGVEVKINGGPYQPAALTLSGVWSLPDVPLIAGDNTVVARAIDAEDHVAESIPRRVHYAVMSELVVRGDGPGIGTISASFFAPLPYHPAQPPQVRTVSREIGETLLLVATPAEDSVFDRWISNGILSEQQALSPRLTVQMQPDLQLTARFVRNPFTPVRGRYFGLIESSDPLQRGTIKGRLADSGAFTLSIRIGRVTIPVKGQFSAEGAFDSVVVAGDVAYGIRLQLNVTGVGQRQITGSVFGRGFEAAATADLSTFSKDLNPLPAELVGTYNLLLPPALFNTDSNFPAGIGYGRLTVTPGGNATFVGQLGDGTPVTTSGAVAGEPGQDERYSSLFASLYSRSGSLAGRLTIDLTHPDHDVSGSLEWFKPAKLTARGQVKAGFSGEIDMAGGKFVRDSAAPAAFLNGAQLSIAAPASLTLPAWSGTAVCTVDATGTITVTPQTGSVRAPSTLRVDAKTGLLSGSLLEGSRPRAVAGLVVPRKLQRAGGFLLRGGRSASITITPAP